MTRYWYIFAVLICLIALPAQAGETYKSDIGFSNAALVKSSFNSGDLGIEIYADHRVDIASLVADIDFSKLGSAQEISDRVNERRRRLYPEEEIIFSITPKRSMIADGANKAALVRAILWWNNTNCSSCYWYANYTSSIATMFIANIEYGGYDIYDKAGNVDWFYRWEVNAGDAGTLYNFGPKKLRGFRGDAVGVPSQADIVMYFFK